MSLKKAQKIANVLEDELGFSLVSYNNTDLEFLRNKLEEFLDLDVESDELEDPTQMSDDDGPEASEEEEEGYAVKDGPKGSSRFAYSLGMDDPEEGSD